MKKHQEAIKKAGLSIGSSKVESTIKTKINTNPCQIGCEYCGKDLTKIDTHTAKEIADSTSWGVVATIYGGVTFISTGLTGPPGPAIGALFTFILLVEDLGKEKTASITGLELKNGQLECPKCGKEYNSPIEKMNEEIDDLIYNAVEQFVKKEIKNQ
jgi:transcription elongation factor Elf1